MHTRSTHVYMAEATDGTQGGTGAGATASTANAGAGGESAGASGGNGAAASAGATAGSLLATGATAAGGGEAAAKAADGAGDPYAWMPEKHRVYKEDKSLDIEASSRKLAENTANLEKRMGTGDIPPKTADEYAPKIEREGFDWETFKADPEMQGFLKAAHAKGLTNDQLGFVLDEYIGRVSSSPDNAVNELKKDWKTEPVFKQNMSLAYKAFTAFAPEADRSRIDEVGNNPVVIRLLAAIGKEMQEDSPGNPGAALPQTDFDSQVAELRDQLGKLPTHDPRRVSLREKLDGLYNSRYGTKPQRLGGGTVRAA